MSRWGPEGPPEEAYSRVSRDIEALYAGLHAIVAQQVAELMRAYDVTDRGLTLAEQTRLGPHDRGVAIAAVDPASSPLLLGFPTSPGVAVAFGHWGGGRQVPSCECDACDLSLAEAVEELNQVIAQVVGGFTERVGRSGLRVTHELLFRDPQGEAKSWLDRPEARRLGLRRSTIVWAPWPRR